MCIKVPSTMEIHNVMGKKLTLQYQQSNQKVTPGSIFDIILKRDPH